MSSFFVSFLASPGRGARRSMSLGLAVALTFVGVSLASAPRADAQTLQQPEARQGFYVSFGLGANALATWDKGHSQGPWGGMTWAFRAGEMLTDRWGLGLAFESGSAKNGDLTAGLGGLTLEAQARLWRHLAWHVGTGFGVAVSSDPSRTDDVDHGGYGPLVTSSLTYDAFFTGRASGGWAVTPGLGMRALRGGDVNAIAVFATVGVSWWSGLPSRELMPAAAASASP